jgi:hypothetical protein
MLEEFDLNLIQDEVARQIVIKLLNLVENLMHTNQQLREENQQLRDEVNRLKGEKGKPDFKAKSKEEASQVSSEPERKTAKPHHKSAKQAKIVISREEVLKVDHTKLPPDATFKGHEEVVVQDLILKTENVRFLKEKYYSATEHKTYLAEVPPGYEGQFGPGVKALSLALYFSGGLSEPKLLEVLQQAGLVISEGQISNLLVQGETVFEKERQAIFEAGVSSSDYQHLDDTSTSVDGELYYCHILCNPYYTAYFTLPHKDRLSVLKVLQGGRQPQFMLNQQTLEDLALLDLPLKWQRLLSEWPQDEYWDEKGVEEQLAQLEGLGEQWKKLLKDLLAITAYQNQSEVRVVEVLVSDDAPQFHLVTLWLALCWVHEGRAYKKLNPLIAHHQRVLEVFLAQFWKYYRELLAYRQAPSPEEAERLGNRFEELFGQVTEYEALNEQLVRSLSKKESLLVVLQKPHVPLHNNPAELGARQRVRKRDVSYGPRSPDGVKAWDIFQTLVETSKKLGVNFYRYVYDRLTKSGQIASLADLIMSRAQASVSSASL